MGGPSRHTFEDGLMIMTFSQYSAMWDRLSAPRPRNRQEQDRILSYTDFCQKNTILK